MEDAMDNFIEEVILSNDDIKDICERIGQQITKDYEGKTPILVGLLKGSIPFLAELINYDNAAMKDIKHCIELRQACAALAFRLFDWKTVNCGKGVEKWREICKSSDEANEVRNQWIR